MAESNEPQLLQHHCDFANFHEGYVRSYISLADAKAAILFAVASSATAYLFSNAALQPLLLRPVWSITSALAVVTAGALILAAGLAAWVIAPRATQTGEGLVFFGAVRQFLDDDAYVAAVRQSSLAELTHARLRHCYNVSSVCSRKYQVLRRAIWTGVTGLTLLLGTIAMVTPIESTTGPAVEKPSRE